LDTKLTCGYFDIVLVWINVVDVLEINRTLLQVEGVACSRTDTFDEGCEGLAEAQGVVEIFELPSGQLLVQVGKFRLPDGMLCLCEQVGVVGRRTAKQLQELAADEIDALVDQLAVLKLQIV